MCMTLSTLVHGWKSLMVLSLTCITLSEGFHAFTALETRRSPYQNWTLHRNDYSRWRSTPTVNRNTSFQRSDQNARSAITSPPLELLDEPHRSGFSQKPGYISNIDLERPAYRSHHSRESTSMQTHRNLPPRTLLHSRNYNSFPPWYADKYRRMPRDESDRPMTGVSRLPWNYQPRCRSCGRPMLQDSFCSDDFVLLIYVYRSLQSHIGDREYMVYVYKVYKDIKRQVQPSQYNRITYQCDWFHSGPILGQFYLVTGLYVNGVPTVDSCSWKAPWNEVTRQQERYLRSKYSLFCGICKIQRVLRLNPDYHKRSDTCYVSHSPNPNEMVCRDRFSICRYKRQSRSCSFNKRTPYDVCEKWLSNK